MADDDAPRPMSIKDRIAAMKLEQGSPAASKPPPRSQLRSSKATPKETLAGQLVEEAAKLKAEKKGTEARKSSISNDSASEDKVLGLIGKSSLVGRTGSTISVDKDVIFDEEGEDKGKRMSAKLGIKADTAAERRTSMTNSYPDLANKSSRFSNENPIHRHPSETRKPSFMRSDSLG